MQDSLNRMCLISNFREEMQDTLYVTMCLTKKRDARLPKSYVPYVLFRYEMQHNLYVPMCLIGNAMQDSLNGMCPMSYVETRCRTHSMCLCV